MRGRLEVSVLGSMLVKRIRVFLVNAGFRRPLYPLVTPPMGIMYLAGYLRSKMDMDLRLVNQRLDNVSDDALVREIVEFGADVVGLGGLTPAASHLANISELVRAARPETLIVLGGPHVSSFGADALKGTAADVAVAGAGERALELIIRSRFEGGSFGDIPGVFWRDASGEIITNPGTTPEVEEIDSLPFPAYDLIELPAYWRRQSMAPIPRRRYASLFSSRGCPCGCKWCHRIFGKRFQGHSAERIVAEIEHLQRQYGITDFEFIDDIFNHDSKRVSVFCDLLHQKNLTTKFAFPNAVRGDVLTEPIIDALVSVGTYFCSFALESGSPRIQEAMGKRLNIPRFVQNVEATAKRGVFTNGFMMMGFPTETEEDMQMTIDVASQSRLHTASFFTVTPFPNTELYNMVMQLHPERMEHVSFEDMNYCLLEINVADVSNEVLFHYQRKANRTFYLNPKRLARILRDFPQPLFLPIYAGIFLNRLTKGLRTVQGQGHA